MKLIWNGLKWRREELPPSLAVRLPFLRSQQWMRLEARPPQAHAS